MAIESYNADTGQYPSSLTQLTGTSPPYLIEAVATKCGSNVVEGNVQNIHMCILNNVNSSYYVQYFQWDLDGPVLAAQYYERLYKIPFNTGVCGTVPAGTRYFYEQFNGRVTMSGCGFTS